MGRSIMAVLAGATLWAILWIGSNAALAAIFPSRIVVNEYIGHVGILTTMFALSVVYSVLAGYATGVVARTNRVGHGVALGVLQLALGIFFQAQYWQLMPLWYHLPFLALLLPANVYGAWLRDAAGRRVNAIA
ncbi:MAG: hypothetical protein O7I93_02610 [Gemmatimonadetes bacterium]|nr:hypothetical protein [Gemmatimonadota bacterium]